MSLADQDVRNAVLEVLERWHPSCPSAAIYDALLKEGVESNVDISKAIKSLMDERAIERITDPKDHRKPPRWHYRRVIKKAEETENTTPPSGSPAIAPAPELPVSGVDAPITEDQPNETEALHDELRRMKDAGEQIASTVEQLVNLAKAQGEKMLGFDEKVCDIQVGIDHWKQNITDAIDEIATGMSEKIDASFAQDREAICAQVKEQIIAEGAAPAVVTADDSTGHLRPLLDCLDAYRATYRHGRIIEAVLNSELQLALDLIHDLIRRTEA